MAHIGPVGEAVTKVVSEMVQQGYDYIVSSHTEDNFHHLDWSLLVPA